MPRYTFRDCRSFIVIVTRELRSHSRNQLVWGLTIFAATLAAVSAHLGTRDFIDRLASHSELTVQRQHDGARSERELTGWRLDPALRAVRGPEPLSALVTGFDVALPDFWDFGPAGRRTGRQHVRSADVLGRIDLEFIIRIVLGLLALVLVLESIADERANGTLLALLAQAIRPEIIIGGKLASGALTLSGAVIVTVTAALLGMLLSATGVITTEFLGSLALLGLSGCLYLFTCFAMGALVSSALSSYRIALAATMIIWLFSAVVALPLTYLIAANVSPVLSASLLESESDRIARERTEQAERAVGQEYLAAVPAGVHWSRAAGDPAWAIGALARLEPVWDRHISALAAELDALNLRASTAASRQNSIARCLALVSPGAQFSASAMSVVGTGNALVQTWELQTTQYEAELNRLLFHNRPRLTGIIPADASGASDNRQWEVGLNRRPFPTIDSLPVFAPPPPRVLGHRVADAAPHLVALSIYAIGLLAAATFAFGRIRF